MTTPEARWPDSDLATIEDTAEITVATRRRDSTLRSARIIWIVRVEDALYVRSVNGTDAAWYRGVQTVHQGRLVAGTLERDVTFIEVGTHAGGDETLDEAVDAAYRTKYRAWPGPTAQMIAAPARATTLRVDPA